MLTQRRGSKAGPVIGWTLTFGVLVLLFVSATPIVTDEIGGMPHGPLGSELGGPRVETRTEVPIASQASTTVPTISAPTVATGPLGSPLSAPPRWTYLEGGPPYYYQGANMFFVNLPGAGTPLFLFGGFDGQSDSNITWEETPQGWGILGPASNISPRTDAAAAYYPPLDGMVLFGGTLDGVAQGGTWVFNYWGDSLTPPCCGYETWYYANVSGPSPRWGAAFAYDPSMGALILFGGRNGSADLGDTWIFRGTSWAELHPALSPSPRDHAAMAWDSALGGLILFGGYELASGTTLNDTWEFSNGNWSQLQPTAVPPGRYSAGATPDQQNLVLTGGRNSTGWVFGDTWRFANDSWVNLPAANGQSDCDFSIVTEPNGRPLVYGGEGNVNGSIIALDELSVAVQPLVLTEAGAPAHLEADAAAGLPPYNYTWLLPNGTKLWGANPSPIFSQPGNYTVNLTVVDNAEVGLSISEKIAVLPSLTLSFPLVTSSVADAGQDLTFSTQATGGSGDYEYQWISLPTGCQQANSSMVTCRAMQAGNYSIWASVTDSLGYAAKEGPVVVRVYGDPTITSFIGVPQTVLVGHQLELTALTLGGAPPVSYVYAGLPSGCSTADLPILLCHPSSTGMFSVVVTITDSVGMRNSSAFLVDVRAAQPSSAVALVIAVVAATGIAIAALTVFLKRRRRAQ